MHPLKPMGTLLRSLLVAWALLALGCPGETPVTSPDIVDATDDVADLLDTAEVIGDDTPTSKHSEEREP